MSQTLLGITVGEGRKKCRRETALYVGLAWTAVAIHVALCCAYVAERHYLLLTLNVAIDVLCSWVIIFRINEILLPLKRLIRLQSGKKRSLSATVDSISDDTQRIPGLDCLVVTANGRRLFLPVRGCIRVTVGETYGFELVDNVIVEVRS